MKQLGLFLVIIITVFSCKEDDDLKSFTEGRILECIGTVETPQLFSPVCDSGAISNSILFCESRLIGNFQLEDSSKVYMPKYCEPVNLSIDYINTNEEIMSLKIATKVYHQSRYFIRTMEQCDDDSTKTIRYCIENERLAIGFESPELEITIEISTRPDSEDPTFGEVADLLEIVRTTGTDTVQLGFPVTIAYTELSAIIAQRTLPYDMKPNQEFYESIDILGRTFHNVISNKRSNTTFTYKYYYNKQYGLVGFIDSSGMTWRIIN